MYQEQRLSTILKLLQKHKQLSSQEMMDYFNVSRDTIRRDFSILSERKQVKRTHGGIILVEIDTNFPSFNERLQRLTKEKKNIAQKALPFIEDEKIYFFDVSTIILNLAQIIDSKSMIYTHSLDNSIVLSDSKANNHYLLGGKFFPKNRFFYSLNEAELLEKINFDIVFFGAAGLKNGEVSFEDNEDAYLKSLILKRAKKKILLAEQKKFELTSSYSVGNIDDFDYFITDKEPQNDIKKIIPKNVTIIY